MKKLAQMILLTGLLFAITSQAQHNGNGGAGIVQNGITMTFGSAKLVVSPRPSQEPEVPMLSETLAFVVNHPALPSSVKQRLYDALVPSERRSYRPVTLEFFTPEKRAQLKAEYKKIIKTSEDQITLLAVTNTEKGVTFLLPEYYPGGEKSLRRDSERMAILIHEAYWILYPDSTYEKVVQVEVAAQNLIENPNEAQAIIDFLTLFTNRKDETARAALNTDTLLKNDVGFTQVSANSATAEFEFLFPKDLQDCVFRGEEQCGMYFSRNLYELGRKNPHSLFLQYLRSKLANTQLHLLMTNAGNVLNLMKAKCFDGQKITITLSTKQASHTYIQVEGKPVDLDGEVEPLKTDKVIIWVDAKSSCKSNTEFERLYGPFFSKTLVED
jgi:hypothetical protein